MECSSVKLFQQDSVTDDILIIQVGRYVDILTVRPLL